MNRDERASDLFLLVAGIDQMFLVLELRLFDHNKGGCRHESR